jgi:tagatose-1,6-bisphosphate aldolase
MKLSALQTSAGMYSLVELDQVAKLAVDLGVSLKEYSGQEIVSKVVSSLVATFKDTASGLVVEPNYGLPALSLLKSEAGESAASPGLVCALESASSDEVDPLQTPKLIENWGVPEVKNNYGVAKMTLFYHPGEDVALKEKQLIAEIYQHCQQESIDLFLKLMLYTPADENFSLIEFQDSQITAVQELRNSCDLMALQYPQDSLACATITTELDIPWVVVGDGLKYDQFKEVVRDSLDGGAKGILAGEVLWQEIANQKTPDTTPDLQAITEQINTEAHDRLIELTRIIDGYAS